MLKALEGADVLRLHREDVKTWRALCEHLKLPPPDAQYPTVRDIGLRRHRCAREDSQRIARQAASARPVAVDRELRAGWAGISATLRATGIVGASRVCFEDDLAQIQSARWVLRNDTFPGNLGFFRPANVTQHRAAVSRSQLSRSHLVFGISAQPRSRAAPISCSGVSK